MEADRTALSLRAEPVQALEAAMVDLFVRVLVLTCLHPSPHSTMLPT